MSTVLLDAVAQCADLINSLTPVINEWTAQHLRVLDGIGMDLWSIDIGIHDLQMSFGNISGSGSRGDQMGPDIPVINQRFHLNILSQVESFVVRHASFS